MRFYSIVWRIIAFNVPDVHFSGLEYLMMVHGYAAYRPTKLSLELRLMKVIVSLKRIF